MSKWGGPFWIATGERVGATFLMAYFGLWLGPDVTLDVFEFDWYSGLGAALAAALLSLVKCALANLKGPAGPSLANERLSGRHRKLEA